MSLNIIKYMTLIKKRRIRTFTFLIKNDENDHCKNGDRKNDATDKVWCRYLVVINYCIQTKS